jgi:hypothetical protein
MGGWEWVIYLVASYVLSVALAPKPAKPQPVAFEDFEFPQVEEGTPQCVVFGDCWSSDWTVLAIGNYSTQAVESSGGKK